MAAFIQVVFVGVVIFITHKIYECFRRLFSSGACGGRGSAAATANSKPAHNPPAYESLYPSLSKEKPLDTPLPVGSALARVFGWGGRSPTFQTIGDNFTTLEDVSRAIRRAGLESSNLIFGIDYTKSNLYTGQHTFGGRSLHSIQDSLPNPYQQAISILGQTLAPFDDDQLLPVFGFGDSSTQGHSAFPFRSDGVCHGFGDVLDCYNRITPTVSLSGPTDFAPVINKAIKIVKETKSYHILVIVADGQVTSERRTREAIVAASRHPLSIIVVGVGDGPWDLMREFDDRLPRRSFDNFQFVEFHRLMSSAAPNREALFALHALMEIPDQFLAIRKLHLLD